MQVHGNTVEVQEESRTGGIPIVTVWGIGSLLAHIGKVRTLERAEVQSLRNHLAFSRTSECGDVALQMIYRLWFSNSSNQAANGHK